MNNDLIHFNKRKKKYFDRVEQRETKMRLQYKLFCAEVTRQCLQQVNNLQSVAIKVNSVIIVKKLFFFQKMSTTKKNFMMRKY